MKSLETLSTIIGWLVMVVAVIVFVSFLVATAWSWVVPDVFAGAVEQGLLPASISWLQAFKLSILLWFLGITRTSSSSKD